MDDAAVHTIKYWTKLMVDEWSERWQWTTGYVAENLNWNANISDGSMMEDILHGNHFVKQMLWFHCNQVVCIWSSIVLFADATQTHAHTHTERIRTNMSADNAIFILCTYMKPRSLPGMQFGYAIRPRLTKLMHGQQFI